MLMHIAHPTHNVQWDTILGIADFSNIPRDLDDRQKDYMKCRKGFILLQTFVVAVVGSMYSINIITKW